MIIANFEKKILIVAIASLFCYSLAPGMDCFGEEVSQNNEMAKVEELHPWIDTAQDTAHVPLFHETCVSNPEYCEGFGFTGTFGAHLDVIPSEARMDSIAQIWADDLNNEFQLRRMKSYNPFQTEPFQVDSAHNFLLGPWLWITKQEILNLAKKCYISGFKYAQLPVNSIGKKLMAERAAEGRRINVIGQKLDMNSAGKSGLYPSPVFPAKPH